MIVIAKLLNLKKLWIWAIQKKSGNSIDDESGYEELQKDELGSSSIEKRTRELSDDEEFYPIVRQSILNEC